MQLWDMHEVFGAFLEEFAWHLGAGKGENYEISNAWHKSTITWWIAVNGGWVFP